MQELGRTVALVHPRAINIKPSVGFFDRAFFVSFGVRQPAAALDCASLLAVDRSPNAASVGTGNVAQPSAANRGSNKSTNASAEYRARSSYFRFPD